MRPLVLHAWREVKDRIRGRRLQAIREDWFSRFPLCVRCEKAGRTRLACDLDHIIPLEVGGPDFDADAEQNRQGLCKPCHKQKTAEDRHYRPSAACDVRGRPTDPRHHWNLAR